MNMISCHHLTNEHFNYILFLYKIVFAACISAMEALTILCLSLVLSVIVSTQLDV